MPATTAGILLYAIMSMIVGVDEVGRGAWAGPLVVGAVLLGNEPIQGLTDSKKLTKKQRELLDFEIRQKAKAIGLGWVSASLVDKIGLSQALKFATRRALAHVRADYSEIIIDGTVAFVDGSHVTTMAKADLLIPSVSAASIVAKTARDRYMNHMDTVFPGYKFGAHVGYGTAAHRLALKEQGASPIHRLSFEPLRDYRQGMSIQTVAVPGTAVSSTKITGMNAESAVADFLQKEGHIILDRNWRTSRCEIDIVSRLGQRLYFTEVKYRKNDRQGGGVAAITTKKLRQMKFAARIYLHSHRLDETDACLAVVDVTGEPPRVLTYLEIS